MEPGRPRDLHPAPLARRGRARHRVAIVARTDDATPATAARPCRSHPQGARNHEDPGPSDRHSHEPQETRRGPADRAPSDTEDASPRPDPGARLAGCCRSPRSGHPPPRSIGRPGGRIGRGARPKGGDPCAARLPGGPAQQGAGTGAGRRGRAASRGAVPGRAVAWIRPSLSDPWRLRFRGPTGPPGSDPGCCSRGVGGSGRRRTGLRRPAVPGRVPRRLRRDGPGGAARRGGGWRARPRRCRRTQAGERVTPEHPISFRKLSERDDLADPGLPSRDPVRAGAPPAPPRPPRPAAAGRRPRRRCRSRAPRRRGRGPPAARRPPAGWRCRAARR